MFHPVITGLEKVIDETRPRSFLHGGQLKQSRADEELFGDGTQPSAVVIAHEKTIRVPRIWQDVLLGDIPRGPLRKVLATLDDVFVDEGGVIQHDHVLRPEFQPDNGAVLLCPAVIFQEGQRQWNLVNIPQAKKRPRTGGIVWWPSG